MLLLSGQVPGIAGEASRAGIRLSNPKPFKVICYSGFRDGQGPGRSEPSEAQVREDLRILAPYTHGIRTYGSGTGTHGNDFVPRICDELGLKLHLGIWIDDTYDEAVNLKAVTDGIAVAKRGHASIQSIVVGNEYMLRVRSGGRPVASGEARLIRYIRKVQAEVPDNIAVTTADTWGDWMSNSDSLIGSLDYLLWHTHPWWERKPVENTEAHLMDVSSRIKARLAGKFGAMREVLGEVGWPSSADNAPSVGSEENQAKFFKSLHAWAWNAKAEYWAFSGFDESWKVDEGPVGAHWGLWKADRSPKAAMARISEIIPDSSRWPPGESVSVSPAGPGKYRTKASPPSVGYGSGRIIAWDARNPFSAAGYDFSGRQLIDCRTENRDLPR